MTEITSDVVVIGTGPGGEGAAMQLAKGGKRVTVIENSGRIGGGCTHRGTIPSKALRYSIYKLTEAMKIDLFKNALLNVDTSIASLRKSAAAIIGKQESMRQNFYRRNNVDVIFGTAHFVDANTVQVDQGELIRAEQFVIATGSRPYRPNDVDFSHPRIFDSDTILDLVESPKSITVYGAGVVGCEYASMFRNLEIKVNLVNSRASLLDFLDDEISDALSYHMRERGMVIRHNENIDHIVGEDDGVVLFLQSGKQLKSDILLWAAGRTGNSDLLALDKLGITPDSRGYIETNTHFQTSVPHVYAVGDVVGFPSLASAAYTQGRAAGMHILGCEDAQSRLLGDIPTGIYTSPEISSIGKTEKELTEAKVPYEVGHTQFKSLARAQITGQTAGMLKILFHRETLEILGVHCFGPNASEIVHIGQAIMSQKGEANSLLYFITTTFNYPTMAEAYRVAALNGYNRLF
jgi:NAD(P) transhydrogenase